MWLLLLVVGAVAVAAVSRSPRACPPPPVVVPPPLPGPISVLGEYLRFGQVPPPAVILCAIAEAETIGRDDLVADIVQAFVAPVVRQHALGHPYREALATSCSRVARPASSRSRPASSRSPRAEVPRTAAMSMSIALMAPHGSPAPSFQGFGLMMSRTSAPLMPALRASEPLVPAPHAELSPPQRPVLEHGKTARLPTDEDLRAMLNADPRRFVELATRGALVIEAPVLQKPLSAPEADPAPLEEEPQAIASEEVFVPENVEVMPGSPLAGVADDAWLEFVSRLSRESPLFSSSRHIGQYRQRRERLADLGVDPATLQGSTLAQRAALDADLLDAHRHCAASGVFAEHLDRAIAVPGTDQPERITLSGVLGVVQCAGLEGAVGWLARLSDRRRYPHTTQAFLRTNGVF